MMPCEQIVARVPLKINYMEVHCDTKTKDNVFVKVVVAGTLLFPPVGFLSEYKCTNSFICLISFSIPTSRSSIQSDGR